MQNLKLPFKIFLLPSLLVNNILDSVPLQIYMAVNTLKKNNKTEVLCLHHKLQLDRVTMQG